MAGVAIGAIGPVVGEAVPIGASSDPPLRRTPPMIAAATATAIPALII